MRTRSKMISVFLNVNATVNKSDFRNTILYTDKLVKLLFHNLYKNLHATLFKK